MKSIKNFLINENRYSAIIDSIQDLFFEYIGDPEEATDEDYEKAWHKVFDDIFKDLSNNFEDESFNKALVEWVDKNKKDLKF